MSQEEYTFISNKLQDIFNTRNNLLTFSFTAVLAVLAVAFTEGTINVPAVYLLPFFLILPFTGRIVYYRNEEARLLVCLEEAGMHSYLKIFNRNVKDSKKGIYFLIRILVNYEMFFLSVACVLLCVCKYPKQICTFNIVDYIYFAIALVCTGSVFAIITSSFDFDKIRKEYSRKILFNDNKAEDENK